MWLFFEATRRPGAKDLLENTGLDGDVTSLSVKQHVMSTVERGECCGGVSVSAGNGTLSTWCKEGALIITVVTEETQLRIIKHV
jgi:hypothetical protein